MRYFTIALALAWKSLGTIKDGYLWLIDQIEAHPQIGLWGAIALVIGAYVV